VDESIVKGMKQWMERDLKISPLYIGDVDFSKYENPYDTICSCPSAFRIGVRNKSIASHWAIVKDHSPAVFLLLSWGFGLKESCRALAHMKGNKRTPTLDELKANPYFLVGSRIPFDKIDRVASDTGLKQDGPERIVGFIAHILSSSFSSGHLCLSKDNIVSQLKTSLELDISSQDLDAIVDKDRYKTIVSDHGYIYSDWTYYIEHMSSLLLRDFIAETRNTLDLDPIIDKYESINGITLSEKQRSAVKLAVTNNVFILTGLPGTGKTTITKCMCYIFSTVLGETPLLLTPTGVAARNLESVTGIKAFTIHKALGFRGVAWTYNEENKYPAKVVIVDELSMVDQKVFYHLISAFEPTTRLIFVGDAAQLPSVGPGNVLHQLVASGTIPTVALTEIYRQEEASDIILNAHNINSGKSFTIHRDPPDFIFIKELDPLKILDMVLSIAKKLYSEDKEFQIIAPMYKGEVGVDALNESMREFVNPQQVGKPEINISGIRFRVGDRIIITKNSYSIDVYNGDIGKIKEVDFSSNVVTLKLYKPARHIPLQINSDELESLEIKPAYAITVHKTQGLQFQYVILPLVMKFFPLLQRNLLYTGVTRAMKKMIIIGDEKAVSRAIGNNSITKRNTLLAIRLKEAMASL
jgi:exodeoxyribonuclease V alpha subunit